MSRPRVLIIPEWYPTSTQPGRAPWAREHARAISAHADVVVLAPEAGRTSGLLRVIDREEDGLRVVRARHPAIGDYRLAYGLRIAALGIVLRGLEAEGFVPELI